MGLFEAAQGGTLLLDELPSLTLASQAKVLTAIEDHKIRRVGGNKSIPVDARIIAAINQWRYSPYMIDHQPVPICVAVTFIYSQR